MAAKQGNLSINSDNIFPIIKKWLYSDHDIFVRELISNGCDAITKLKKLDMMGEYALPGDYKAKVEVIVSPEKKTMTFIDNGLGMTAEEMDEYINQIAFSGAADFIEKYKDKTNDDQIIGHFGLGFYSAFMVADEVHIDSLSYREGAKPVHWECDGGTQFTMDEGDMSQVGTKITLFINEDCLKFCNEYEARSVIQKYCSFMPTEIYLSKENTQDTETIEEGEKLPGDTVLETIQPEKDGDPVKLKITKRPELMNDTNPLWAKHPNECTKEDYLEFYRKVFMDYKEPLFWIHLNMDYPFNLKGILYFPKINMEYESIEGTIKLYNNQVFIADNIKEVIPGRSSSRKEACKQPPIPCGGRFFGMFGRMICCGDRCQQRIGASSIDLHLLQSARERIDKDALSEDAVLEVGAAPGNTVTSASDDDVIASPFSLDARTTVLCAVLRTVGQIKEVLRRDRRRRRLLRNRLRILPTGRRLLRQHLFLCMTLHVVSGGGPRFELRVPEG